MNELKNRFSIIAKILFLKFPLEDEGEDGGEGIHLKPPPPHVLCTSEG